MSDFKNRCEMPEKCLPADSEYRNMLERLHKEMQIRIAELEFHKENKACMGCWGEIRHCDCGLANT